MIENPEDKGMVFITWPDETEDKIKSYRTRRVAKILAANCRYATVKFTTSEYPGEVFLMQTDGTVLPSER